MAVRGESAVERDIAYVGSGALAEPLLVLIQIARRRGQRPTAQWIKGWCAGRGLDNEDAKDLSSALGAWRP